MSDLWTPEGGPAQQEGLGDLAYVDYADLLVALAQDLQLNAVTDLLAGSVGPAALINNGLHFAMGGRSGAYTLSFAGTNVVPLDTRTAAYDPNGLINTTSGGYVVPEPGVYFCSAQVRVDLAAVSTIGCYVVKGNASSLEGDVAINAPAGISSGLSCVGAVQCAAGDLLRIGVFCTSTASTLYISNPWPIDNRLTVFRIA